MPQPTRRAPDSATAYSYIRFSSAEQAKGDSIRRQIALRDAWLARTGVRLDESAKLRDEGVSAYTGTHRANPDRNALAGFLELVKRGQVARGSYLIVESLDRLTREHIRPALTLLLNLIDQGVRIVQLLPVEAVYDEKVEPMTLMMAIMELSRGHSESRMKAERSAAGWAARRERARTGAVMTRMTPPWLRVVNGKYVLIPSATETIRRIFQLARAGHGTTAITKTLNAQKVPNVGKARQWQRSYVCQLLLTRKVVGEYQPLSGGRDRRDRKPDGQPIPNFFPAVVTEDEWLATRAVVAGRKHRRGRPAKSVHLFTGLLRDARDGGAIHIANKTSATSRKKGHRILTSARAVNGVPGALSVSFPAAEFEAALLAKLREIDPKQIVPRGDAGAGDKILSLAGRLAELEKRIGRIKAAIVGDGDIEPLIDSLRKLEGERKTAAAALDHAKQAAAAPLSAAWAECGTLLDVLGAANDPHEARTRLRSAIRQVVSEIWCLFVAPGGRWRVAAVQIRFDGGAHRDYLVLLRGGCGNVAHRADRRWWVKSFAEVAGKRGLDLRERRDVANLESALARIKFDQEQLP